MKYVTTITQRNGKKVDIDISKLFNKEKPAVGSWTKVKETWEKAVSFAKSIESRGALNNKVDQKQRSLRVISCHGNKDMGIPPCKARDYSKDKKYHYCNECGCGEREIARLDAIGSEENLPTFKEEDYNKLDYPYLECPLKKQGFSNHIEDTRQKIIIRHFLSPGDVVMLTAAVRDLDNEHGSKFAISVETTAPELWQYNPHVTFFDKTDPSIKIINAEYSLINDSNNLPYHFINAFRFDLERKLNIKIPSGPFCGDIHISTEEKKLKSQIEEMGISDKFWIIMAGGKYDFTTKWWNPEYYQKVVDHFRGKITFVQCGEEGHWHPKLKNVINLVGKTDIRQFVRLVYNSIGVLCPITFAMHLAAGVPTKPGNAQNRACVVIAGGREPTQWEAYPTHRYISRVGSMKCCATGGCWRSKCHVPTDDKTDKDICQFPISAGNIVIPECMDSIRPEEVISSIESYYTGGLLTYGSTI